MAFDEQQHQWKMCFSACGRSIIGFGTLHRRLKAKSKRFHFMVDILLQKNTMYSNDRGRSYRDPIRTLSLLREHL